MQSKIVLGTVQFGLNYGINNHLGKPDQNTVNDILNRAFANNIRLLDSAEAYGDAHEVIGNYHRDCNNKFDVITKYSKSRSDLPENLKARVLHHLDVLNVESIYCYMFHNFNDFADFGEEMLSDLKSLKDTGMIKNIGVSVYTNHEVEQLLERDDIDVIQLPFNMLDNHSFRGDILKRAKNQGIEIHTRSVFLQGLFFKEISELPEKIVPLTENLNEIKELSAFHQLSVSDLALNYACHQEYIDKVLIGVDSTAHLEENLNAIKSTFPTELMKKLDSIKVEKKTLLNPSNW